LRQRGSSPSSVGIYPGGFEGLLRADQSALPGPTNKTRFLKKLLENRPISTIMSSILDIKEGYGIEL
jgi:hypothetical protein